MNPAGTPWTPLWCDECDADRRATISMQLREIRDYFNQPAPVSPGEPTS